MRIAIVVALLTALTGCSTVGAVSPFYKLDPGAANQCRSYCQALSMELGAVVIIASNTGCVCQPAGKTVSESGGSSAVAGGAMIVMEDQQERQQQK